MLVYDWVEPEVSFREMVLALFVYQGCTWQN
jgi:hypothetical protein